MPKRLHDSGLWSKPWFRVLSPAEKCAFQYLIDHCDGAGVWDADFEAAEFVIGDVVDWPKLPAKVKDNVTVLENGKWWLPDYPTFQCGCKLGPDTTNRTHLSYVKALKKHGLYDSYLSRSYPQVINHATAEGPMLGPNDNDNDNEYDNEKEKDKKEPGIKRLIDLYHALYVQKAGQKPTVTGQWGRNLKTLLRAHTEETVQRVINYFFDYPKRTQWGWNKFMASFDNLLPGATGRKAVQGPAGDGWPCPHCGYTNRQTGSVCFRCHKDRDDVPQGGNT